MPSPICVCSKAGCDVTGLRDGGDVDVYKYKRTARICIPTSHEVHKCPQTIRSCSYLHFKSYQEINPEFMLDYTATNLHLGELLMAVEVCVGHHLHLGELLMAVEVCVGHQTEPPHSASPFWIWSSSTFVILACALSTNVKSP
jgi:hypothetical protein